MSWDPYGPMDIESFMLTSPPRRVPPSIVKAAVPRGAKWFGLIFGGLFLGMGLLFSWIFVPKNLLKQWELGKDSAPAARGTITAVEPTNMRINDVLVMRYRFSYQLPGERRREGKAYFEGNKWDPGDEVRVRYLASNPSYAVPEGARLDETDATTLFVLIFPLVGGGILAGSLFAGIGRRRLLTHGWFSTATVAGMEPTSVTINRAQQFKFRIVRTDDQKEVSMRRHLPQEVMFLQSKLAANEPVKILFDPNKPQRMMFPEAWKS